MYLWIIRLFAGSRADYERKIWAMQQENNHLRKQNHKLQDSLTAAHLKMQGYRVEISRASQN